MDNLTQDNALAVLRALECCPEGQQFVAEGEDLRSSYASAPAPWLLWLAQMLQVPPQPIVLALCALAEHRIQIHPFPILMRGSPARALLVARQSFQALRTWAAGAPADFGALRELAATSPRDQLGSILAQELIGIVSDFGQQPVRKVAERLNDFALYCASDEDTAAEHVADVVREHLPFDLLAAAMRSRVQQGLVECEGM
jgi:hypothetical protein